MKLLDELPILQMEPSEIAARILGESTTFLPGLVLHLPSVEDLLGLVLQSPIKFVTPNEVKADGIRIYLFETKYYLVERASGFSDRREFSSAEACYSYVLILFRRFLASSFRQFGYRYVWNSRRFPLDWKYSEILVLKLFSKCLLSPSPIQFVPICKMPSVAEIFPLLIKKEFEMMDNLIFDGTHIQRVGEAYALKSFDRGVCMSEVLFQSFGEALMVYLKPWDKDGVDYTQYFSGLNLLEFAWNEVEPPS